MISERPKTISDLIDKVIELNCDDVTKATKIKQWLLESIIVPDYVWPLNLIDMNMNSGDVYQLNDPRGTRLFGFRGFFYHSSLGLTVVSVAGHQNLIILMKYFEKPLDTKVSVNSFYQDVLDYGDYGRLIDEYIDDGADFFYNSGASANTINYTNRKCIALRKAEMITQLKLVSLK